MNKYFRVIPKKGDAPICIVADTITDAQCQAREICDGKKPFQFIEDYLPPEFDHVQYGRLNETMSAMFL